MNLTPGGLAYEKNEDHFHDPFGPDSMHHVCRMQLSDT